MCDLFDSFCHVLAEASKLHLLLGDGEFSVTSEVFGRGEDFPVVLDFFDAVAECESVSHDVSLFGLVVPSIHTTEKHVNPVGEEKRLGRNERSILLFNPHSPQDGFSGDKRAESRGNPYRGF